MPLNWGRVASRRTSLSSAVSCATTMCGIVFVAHTPLRLLSLAPLPQEAALRAIERLAATLRAHKRAPVCSTLRVESGSIFYQCVYVRMKDDDALSAWHRCAREAFSFPAPPASSGFMPHLSIIYGDLSDEEKQRRVAAVAADWSALVGSDAGFVPDTLSLWRTPAGLTETWSEIADILVQ
jgi:Cyclic phosphodiesterase-like protein